MLYNQAYPELRRFCNDFGIEFQVIDMRWGVRSTAVVDHSTSSLCQFEVETCKRLSIGPYFVVGIAVKDSQRKIERYANLPFLRCSWETDTATNHFLPRSQTPISKC